MNSVTRSPDPVTGVMPTYEEAVAHARALIRAIDRCRFDSPETDQTRALTDALFSIGQKHLQWYDGKASPSAAASGWVLCSERMPEVGSAWNQDAQARSTCDQCDGAGRAREVPAKTVADFAREVHWLEGGTPPTDRDAMEYYAKSVEVTEKERDEWRERAERAEAELAELRKASGIVSRSQARRINESGEARLAEGGEDRS